MQTEPPEPVPGRITEEEIERVAGLLQGDSPNNHSPFDTPLRPS